MRPEQKIILSCRQTGERAERLLEWLDQSRLMLKAQSRALRVEVQGISNELLGIIEAVEQPPTVGLAGAWGSPRADLACALMSDVQTASAEDEARLALGRERLSALIPRDSDGGATASLRFVAADRAEGPYRFPIRLSLLGQLDLVKILASAYLLHVPPHRQRFASADAVALQLAINAQQVVNQAFSGMARRDIDAIRDTLHAIAPESAPLRRLDASGYWDMLGGLIPHLPEALRRKAFTVLWGEDPALTALFGRLSDAIELLGFSGEGFTGIDALIGRDPVSGWIIRHEDSLIAATTVLTCHDRPERLIRVASRHGRAADVERFVLAALVDEVRLPVDAAALPMLETADMLALPAPRPVMLWPRRTEPALQQRSAAAALTAAEALEIFVAQKASYQLDRAVQRHALTCLVVATDLEGQAGGAEVDAASSALITNWVELTQGETAHVRERRRAGFNILAGRADRDGANGGVFAGPDLEDPRLLATVEQVLDGNVEWAREWTPNRPFRNIFTWRSPRPQPVAAAEAASATSAEILRFERLRPSDGGGGVAATEPAVANDLRGLLMAITQSTTATIHLQQLAARLNETRRALTARFLRLHISNDPLSVVEWRRQICHVSRNRLQRAAQLGSFGRLQKALLFSEDEAFAVLARLKAEDPQQSATHVIDIRTLEPGHVVDACLSAWIAALRQLARAPSLMRALHVPGTVVAHMVDELILGAMRIGLQEKLSEAVRRIQLSTVRAIDCERSVAALLERGINAYVETLDPAARNIRSSVHRDPRFGMGPASNGHAGSGPAGGGAGGSGATGGGRGPGEGGRAGGGAAGAGARRTAAAGSGVVDDWAETFADLVEANILGASLLGGAGHLNRELGEVLSAMSVNTFEVFS